MTINKSEVEAIEHLDFDPESTCESKFGCDKKATWLVLMACCDLSRLLCDGHKKRTETFNQMLRYRTRCNNCDSSVNPETMRFIPLT